MAGLVNYYDNTAALAGDALDRRRHDRGPKTWKPRILWEDGLAPRDAMGASSFPQIMSLSLGHKGPREFTGPVRPNEKRLAEFLAKKNGSKLKWLVFDHWPICTTLKAAQ